MVEKQTLLYVVSLDAGKYFSKNVLFYIIYYVGLQDRESNYVFSWEKCHATTQVTQV